MCKMEWWKINQSTHSVREVIIYCTLKRDLLYLSSGLMVLSQPDEEGIMMDERAAASNLRSPDDLTATSYVPSCSVPASHILCPRLAEATDT